MWKEEPNPLTFGHAQFSLGMTEPSKSPMALSTFAIRSPNLLASTSSAEDASPSLSSSSVDDGLVPDEEQAIAALVELIDDYFGEGE